MSIKVPNGDLALHFVALKTLHDFINTGIIENVGDSQVFGGLNVNNKIWAHRHYKQ